MGMEWAVRLLLSGSELLDMLAQTEINLWQMAAALDYLLSWIGLGCLLGLIATAMLSGRSGTNSVGTVVTAIVGTLLGCGLLQYLNPGVEIRPLSQSGLVVGVTGAVTLLAFFGLLGGYYVRPDIQPSGRSRRRRLVQQYMQED